ncbi:hypothetical protein ES705_25335 [subsurface metagenome]
MFDKQIIKKYNDSTLKKEKAKLPIECKVVLLKEVKRLNKILKRLNRVDKLK